MIDKLPRRAGELWTDAEHEHLIDLLRAGLPLDDIAARLGRGASAVARHCALLLPPGVRLPREHVEPFLRHHVATDPDYDWRAGLRAAAARDGRFYWDPSVDEIVRTGWEQGRPLAELTAATGASEVEVAKRLLHLRLAESTTEVAHRLGCAPDGTLDIRVRMVVDRAAAAVWVLVVDGARDSDRAKRLDRDAEAKAYRHVSLHANPEEAEQTLLRLLAGHADNGGTPQEVSVTLAERTVGDLAVGATHHELAPTLGTGDTGG